MVGELTVGTDLKAADLEALSSLKRIRGNLRLMYNDQLENLNGLRALTGVQGSFEMCANPSLTSLAGLAGAPDF